MITAIKHAIVQTWNREPPENACCVVGPWCNCDHKTYSEFMWLAKLKMWWHMLGCAYYWGPL